MITPNKVIKLNIKLSNISVLTGSRGTPNKNQVTIMLSILALPIPQPVPNKPCGLCGHETPCLLTNTAVLRPRGTPNEIKLNISIVTLPIPQ